MALKSRLTKIATALPREADKAAQQIAEVVQEERDNNVRIDQGELLASGRIIKEKTGVRIFREGEGLPDARAAFTNYGTSKMEADAHMDKGAETGRRAAPGIVEKAVLGVIK